MDVKFTKKQKQYILDRVNSAKRVAKKCQIEYNGDSREYRLYLLGALESVLGDLCGESALDLFNDEVFE